MAYDPNKDKTYLEEWFYGDRSDIRLTVSCYNGGEAKVGLNRFYEKKDGEKQWTKLGRLTMDEYLWVVGMEKNIKKAIRDGKEIAA